MAPHIPRFGKRKSFMSHIADDIRKTFKTGRHKKESQCEHKVGELGMTKSVTIGLHGFSVIPDQTLYVTIDVPDPLTMNNIKGAIVRKHWAFDCKPIFVYFVDGHGKSIEATDESIAQLISDGTELFAVRLVYTR